MKLAKVAKFRNREVVTSEVQQRVQEHRTVTIRQHESVAVGPVRVGRIVRKHAAPQGYCDIGHAHWHARVPGVRLLNRVHCQGADSPRHAHGKRRGVAARDLRNIRSGRNARRTDVG